MHARQTIRILHIEDDAPDAELISLALQRSGFDFDIRLARSRAECLVALEEGEFDLVISDSHGHDLDGPELLRLMLERLPQVPFIFLTGSYDDSDPETLKAAGAAECLHKDDLDALAPAIRRVLAQ